MGINNDLQTRKDKVIARGLGNMVAVYIGTVRNTCAMIAMELIHDGDSNKPNSDLPKALVSAAAAKGLIILSCGIRGNVIRFLPALTISDEIINEGLDILAECLAEGR